MANWEKVCALAEVAPGARKLVWAGVWNILIFNTGRRVFACSNECPHMGGDLDKSGELRGHVVRCREHGYELDLTDGKCLTEAGLTLPVFRTEVRDGWIFIHV